MMAKVYSPQNYRYGFNGKEKVEEMLPGDYDFGARIYASRLGRFLSVDAWMSTYPFQSPYAGLDNNPILKIDPTGNGTEDYCEDQEGNVQWFDNKASEIVDKEMKTWKNVGTSYVLFDGNSLDYHYQTTDTDGNIKPNTFTVPAVSGRPDEKGLFDYSKERQIQGSTGPLPEGNYTIDPYTVRELTLKDDIIGTGLLMTI